MRVAVMIGFGAGAVLAAWAGSPAAPAGADKPRWLSDVAAAQAEARRSQRPILAVLH